MVLFTKNVITIKHYGVEIYKMDGTHIIYYVIQLPIHIYIYQYIYSTDVWYSITAGNRLFLVSCLPSCTTWLMGNSDV